METSMLGLVAGSHNSNEFIIIRQDGDFVREMEGAWCSGEMCEVCGDEIGTGNAEEGAELFVACNECAFPVCRDCYDYERREGNQVCPQCNTRYKRLQGCARVEGDEEEDGIDDLENEFDFDFDGSIKHDDHMEMTMSPQEEEEKAQESHNYDNGNHALVPSNMMSKEMMRRQARAMDPSKDLAAYGYGSVAWKERTDIWRQRQTKLLSNHNNEQDPAADDNNTQFPLMDEGRQPLSRKLGIPSSEINPYRMIIIIRVVVLGFFFHYRVMNPVQNAYVLWVVSVICEIWFTLSWILEQLPKLLPVKRETYLDRLSLRYEREGECSEVCPIDILVNTVDPLKEPPLVTANTILSILALDYPPHKLCCYVSDDAAAILTFEALSQTCEFAKKWVPFCNKFNIEPRAPEWYFAEKLNYLKHKIHPSFVKERRAIKREYEEFRVRINFLVAKANKVPEEGWIMQDGTPWPGNSVRDHPGMIQVFLGKSGGYDMDGNELPRLVYVSREKRPTFNHHRKAGALNSLVRVSAVLSNAPFLLNLDHDSYINNSKVIREAMCFMMDPLLGKRVCFVQFSQRSDGADATNHHQYEYQTSAFFDINMKGLDGIQGPTCVGTRCVYRRQALYGFDAPRKNKSPTRTCNCWPKCGCGWCCMEKRKKKNKTKKPKIEIMDSSHRKVHSEASIAHSAMMNTEDGTARVEDETVAPITDQKLAKKFGQSPIFIASTQLVDGERVKHGSLASLLSEAIHVISCGYEEKTEWGKEVGWIYGSITEDTLTGFKMHCHGWRSIYCIPERPAFKVHAPKDLSNNLQQVFQRALGSIEIFMSKHCPIWYGYDGGLKWLERVSYINAMLYPFTSIPLVAYCALPSVCLLSGNFIIPEVNTEAGIWFLSLFICIFATSVLEMRWSRVRVDEWWRNEQFWVIGSVSAHLFAVFVGIFKVLAGVNTSFEVKAAASNKKEDHSDLLALKWTTFLIIPTTLLVLNMIAMVAGVSHAINNGLESWGPLFGKLLFSLWVILHLYPFLKGMMGRHNRTPTIVLVWSILLASFFSVLWVKIDPFSPISDAPILEECGLDCN